jgi:formyl-CoA transferase
MAALCRTDCSASTSRHRPPRTEAPNALANHYRCRDGRWFLMALHNEPRQLASFLKAIDAEHLAEDPRFATTPARRANARALTAILDGIFVRRDLAEWRPILETAGVTFGAVFQSTKPPRTRRRARSAPWFPSPTGPT